MKRFLFVIENFVFLVFSYQISITPHFNEYGQYSSYIGALQCHVDLAHVANFPSINPCNPICYNLSSNAFPSGYLVFGIDQSAGAYDVSLTAYEHVTGQKGIDGPKIVEVEELPSSFCSSFWDGSILGYNPNIYFECPRGSYSFDNSKLLDWRDIQCTIGTGKECSIPIPGSSYVVCESMKV
jgi:hypothetical protein